jgi:hypothetical protein
VTVITEGRAALGWAFSSGFICDHLTGQGVGDDEFSWAFDGHAGVLLHNSKADGPADVNPGSWGTRWSAGDVSQSILN